MNEQQALLKALYSDAGVQVLEDFLSHTSAQQQRWQQRGLQAYRAHAQVLAERTLLATYPVVSQLLGLPNMNALAPHFWRQHPAHCGDLAQWGQAFAEFLQTAPQLAGKLYLADLARVEWLLHVAATAADSSLDQASFACLSAHEATQLRLRLSPGVAIFASAYPVVRLIQAHQAEQPDLQEVAQLLLAGVGENALIWRQGFKPCVRCCTSAELKLLQTLLTHQSLHNTLAVLGDEVDLDFSAWLVQAVQTGLVVGVVNDAT